MASRSPRIIPRHDAMSFASMTLRPDRGRDPAMPGSAARTGDADDPLSTMMGAIVRDFAADGVLITHQADRGAPVVLFADGACAARAQVEAWLTDPIALAPAPAGEWQPLAGEPASCVLTTSAPAEGGTVTVRTVFRRLVSETGRARARVVAARLQPLLSPFALLWWQRRRAQGRVRDLTQAIDRADIGIVLLDRQGHPTFTNAAARAMIEDGDGLRMNGPMLSGNSLADTLRLHAAIEHVISADGPDASAPVTALPRATRRPLLAAVVAATRDVPAAGSGEAADAGAILYLFDPEQDLRTLIEPACKLYGLSPVETRLTCLLADGASLADAATAMRVREMTARSYLKQIFLKTDTNRQAELVWLMLKSTVRTRAPQAPLAVATPA